MKAGGIILKKNDSPAFFQSRLTDAVSVILSELLSYEHPSKWTGLFYRRRAADKIGITIINVRMGGVPPPPGA